MEQRGILMVLSGFSGAGKGTLVKALLKKYNDYALSISMTTRAPREGERVREGEDVYCLACAARYMHGAAPILKYMPRRAG